jgi:hypothetical protein
MAFDYAAMPIASLQLVASTAVSFINTVSLLPYFVTSAGTSCYGPYVYTVYIGCPTS